MVSILKSKLNAKVKSLTNEGHKAISRAYYFKHEEDDIVYLHMSMLYFSKDNKTNDELVRTIGDTYVYFRTHPIKLDTLYLLLEQLKLIKL